MYLLDTNILLEIILGQEQQHVAEELLNRDDLQFYISDFSLYSIGILLVRLKMYTSLTNILEDIKERNIFVLRLQPDELTEVSRHCSVMNLDFDDGYQYTLAEKQHLKIVSFDRHFDKTPLGRVNPIDLLAP